MRKKYLALLAFTFCGSQFCFAGTIAGAKITGILTNLSGNLFVNLDKVISNAPGCATWNTRYVVDSKAVGGKAQVAQIFEAFAMGRTINAWGAGTCSLHSDTETLNMLESIK